MVKDIFREIKGRKLQFLAILLITTLGVGFFIGIRVTGHDMRLTADAYMQDAKVLDLQVLHSLGIDDEMIEDIDKVLDSKGLIVNSNIVYATGTNFDNVIHLYEYNEGSKSDITLIDGRLPKAKNEAVIDSLLFDIHNLDINDTITVKNNDIFEAVDLNVVGIVQSSLYLNKSRGYTTLGSGEVSGFVYASDLDKKIDASTSVRYHFVDNDEISIKKKKIELEKVSEEISLKRKDRLVAPALEEIAEAELKLVEERAKAEAELLENENKIKAAEADLVKAKAQLEAGIDQLTFGIPTSGTLDERLELVGRGFEAIKSMAQTQIDDLRKRIDELDPNNAASEYIKEILESQLADELKKLDDMVAEFNSGYAQLKIGVAQYNAGVAEVEAGKLELEEGHKTLESELAKAQAEINRGKKEIEDADSGELYVFDRKDAIIGYTDFYNDSERIEAIGAVFPLIFFGVAILVTLSTITQMVEESRSQLGVYKALGYTSFQASLKYVGFAFISWSIGMIFGALIGFFIIPNTIYNAYRILYETPELVSKVVFNYLWTPFIISLLSSVGIAFYKTYTTSRDNAANLLRPPMPKGGQRILLERVTFIWNRLSFLYKVSFRNLFRNKARFLMTIIGIGGTSGILITGFGIDNSVNAVLDKQFNNIFKYDGFVVYEDDVDFEDDIFDSYLDVFSSNVEISNQDTTLYVSDDLDEFSNYFAFNNKGSDEEIIVEEYYAIISEKLALVNKIKVGDDLSFTYNNRKYTVEINAIVENYANHYLFLSEALFEELTLDDVVYNMRFFKSEDTSNEYVSKILENDKVLNVTLLENIEKIFKEQMGNFDIIIYIVISAAFLLELIVLTNLITMNMSERKKELATLKVLGFYPNELAAYILRENIILTFISLVFGTIFGIYLHRFVVITAELDTVMFYRSLNVMSIVKSLLLTIVISYVVNYIMSRRANNVDMSEALKTFDA